jgi:hypothetical protein
MRLRIVDVLVAVLTLVEAGCATGFRAGGPRGGGVSAGTAIGNAPTTERMPTVEPPQPR